MSDSDTDSGCISSVNNVFGYPNESTVRIRGPHVDNTLNLNLRTNSLIVPHNMERQRLTDLSVQPRNFQSSFGGFAQSSMIGGRKPSPTNSMYKSSFRGFAQSSMIGGRPPSPTNSMCSNISTSESIVAALKSGRFSKHELLNMSEAFNKLMKGRIRKRMARRRNRKLFLKGARRQSGYDSGELGSDSSISSDDCRSTRTGITAINGQTRSFYTKSKCGRSSDDAWSTHTNVNELRRTIKDKTLYRDSTDLLKQDSFKNIFSLGPGNITNASMSSTQSKNAKAQNMFQKDRFKNSFQLPSQRFAQSKSVLPIPEECNENNQLKMKNKALVQSNNQRLTSNTNNNLTDSEKDDSIFSEVTDPDNSILKHPQSQRKRNLNSSDDSIGSENKKKKLSSPKTTTKEVIVAPAPKKTCNDFVFAKPEAPVRKLSNIKKQDIVVKPTVDNVEKIKHSTVYKPLSPIKKPTQEQTSIDEHFATMQNSTSEVSMRPSFMKRKLFTQTLDVTENKNSAESSPSGSPAKVYSEIPKEKNKARKLVTSQSCLSRDIPSDENNFLDLIHKIVPRDRMNVTTHTTQRIDIRPQSTETTVKNINNDEEKESEKWDITAILSKCKNDDHSDTYTDEDIFVVHDKKKTNNPKTKETTANKCYAETAPHKSSIKEKVPLDKCAVVLEKLSETKDLNLNTKATNQTLFKYAHAFWNCDSESESQDTPKQHKFTKESNGNAQTKQSNANKSKNSLIKNIKSVLEVTKSSNDSSLSIEDIGNNIETLTINRSLRLKAAKALRDKRTNSPKPCRREELHQSICNTIKRSKSTRDQSSSSTKRSHCKKLVKNKEDNKKITGKVQEKPKNNPLSKKKTSPANQKNCLSNKSTLNTTKETIASPTCLNQDDSESPHLDFTKRGRGRPRKLTNAANATVPGLQSALTSVLKCSNKGGSESPHLDFTTRRRGRPHKLSNVADSTVSAVERASTSLQDKMVSPNTLRKRGRPKRVLTSNTTVSELLTDIGTKNSENKKASSSEKPRPLSKITTRSRRILETPKKSKSDKCEQTKTNLCPKLKATRNKISPEKNESGQHKVTSLKERNQDPHKDNKKLQLQNIQKATIPPDNAAKETVQPKNACNEHKNSAKEKVTSSVKSVIKNANLEDYFCRRTRSSRDKTFLSPVKALSPLTKDNSRNPQKDPLKPPKIKASSTNITNSTASNKENKSYQKSQRVRKNTSAFQCCEEETGKRDRPRDFYNPLQKTNARAKKLVEVQDSPSVPLRSFRSTRDKSGRNARQMSVCKWDLGIAKATIGVVPWHFAPDDSSRTIIDDDCKSVTVRSVASTSILSRSSRPKFLHVW